jgi:hypothetical protein
MVVEGALIGGAVGVAGSKVMDASGGDEKTTLLLTEIRNTLVAIRSFSALQRHRTLYPYNVGASTDGEGSIFRVDGQVRGHHLAFSGGEAGAEMLLYMGTSVILSWYASGSYMDIDLPLMLTAGTSLQVINNDGNDGWACWLWFEREQEDISHRNA